MMSLPCLNKVILSYPILKALVISGRVAGGGGGGGGVGDGVHTPCILPLDPSMRPSIIVKWLLQPHSSRDLKDISTGPSLPVFMLFMTHINNITKQDTDFLYSVMYLCDTTLQQTGHTIRKPNTGKPSHWPVNLTCT